MMNDSIPINSDYMKEDEIKKLNLFINNVPVIDKIDDEILHYFPNFNNDIIINEYEITRKEVYELGNKYDGIIPEIILNGNKFIKQEYLRSLINKNNN